ncbi:subclass B3 metallo-beta-lactamase [Caulobacter endophyticus]|uniref:subclass B3 metallo-beta-lactamase n=1 Tax=Caulobacter endophyticus TaxID=2172652 RepID=UPI00240FA5BD|nr:subclass B3 metallo-beta-lactamase [Caulobacter endophyticus]MDG2529840.1 subclass B3 metallo-beta-lactamase [Caulobacter endophyticus]
MNCKWIMGFGLAGALCAMGTPVAAHDPLLAPIEPDYAARWLKPETPIQVYGNSYVVGFGGLSVALIKTSQGLIVVDAALPQAVPAIEANIKALGFKVTDIKLILSTEPHYDHAGGLAALARDSGATVVASAPAAQALRRGRPGADDPQLADLVQFPAVTKLRVVGDGEVIRLGDVAVTARATPGHTAGSMSWTWTSCERRVCKAVVFGSSLNPVSSDGYRFSDPKNAGLVAGFRRSFDVMRGLKCDVLISAHPDQSGGDERLERARRSKTPNPFVDPGVCRAYADRYAARLDARLAKERAGE